MTKCPTYGLRASTASASLSLSSFNFDSQLHPKTRQSGFSLCTTASESNHSFPDARLEEGNGSPAATLITVSFQPISSQISFITFPYIAPLLSPISMIEFVAPLDLKTRPPLETSSASALI